jgi:integrase
MQNKMTQPKLYTRGKKLWIRFSLNGEVIKKSLNIEDNKANRKLANTNIIPQMILKASTGEFFNSSKEEIKKIPTVSESIVKSLDLHKHKRKIDTQKDLISIFINHIKDFMGSKTIDKVKPSHIEQWQNYMLDKGLSPARVKKSRSILYTMFNDAIKDEIIEKNPLLVVKSPKIPRTIIKPFTLKEIQKILSVSTGWVQNFLALAFFTGARSGEIIGLKWEDIDLAKKQIYIQRSIKMGTISTPKTVNSIRSIDILDSLIPYLEDQYSLTGKKDSFVFLNDKDEHIYDIKRVRNTHWKNVLNLADLEYRPIYHTRHTFATIMLENNEDILWVSNMLGHTDSTMTLSKYARYVKRANTTRATFLKAIA